MVDHRRVLKSEDGKTFDGKAASPINFEGNAASESDVRDTRQ